MSENSSTRVRACTIYLYKFMRFIVSFIISINIRVSSGYYQRVRTYYDRESPLRQAKLVNRAFPRGWYQHHRVKQPIDDLRRHVHVNIEHCLRQWRHGWNNRRPFDLSFSAVLPIFLSSIEEFRTVPSEIEKRTSERERMGGRKREKERRRRDPLSRRELITGFHRPVSATHARVPDSTSTNQ